VPTVVSFWTLTSVTSNKDTWHDTQVFYLTYFLKVREVKYKVQNGTDMGTFHYYFT
jgi:hypothetical protein